MKNNFFITIFVLVSIVFMAVAGDLFLFFKASAEKKAIIDLRKIVLQNNKKNEEEKLLAEALDRLKKEKDIINAVFLKEEDLVRLIKILESIGDNSGVVLKISSISPSSDKELKPKISFAADGSFEQLFIYMEMLENIPYLVTINKVSLQKNQGVKIDKADDKSPLTGSWQALFDVYLESYEKN
ncbi:MAG: hypothetical protein AAB822_02555 [Patescibacteria group bacterium]